MAGIPLRLARRDVARHRGRSLLVVLLVALPVLVLSAFSTLWASSESTEQQAREQVLGQAVAQVSAVRTNVAAQPITHRPALHADQRAVPITHRPVRAVIDGATVDTVVEAANWQNPVFRGQLRGKVANDPAAVWVATGLASTYRIQPGATIIVDGRSVRVAGLYWRNNDDALLVNPGSPLAGKDVGEILVAGAPLEAGQRDGWGPGSVAVLTPDDAISGQGVDRTVISALVVVATLLASTVASTICAAAFSVGIARQRRNLQLLHVAGAPDAVLQRVAASQGLLLGLSAALGGAGLGALGASAWVQAHLADVTPAVFGVNIPWLLLAAMVVIATAGCVLAAWLPARRLVGETARGSLASSDRSDSAVRRPRWAGVLVLAGLVTAVAAGLVARRLMASPHPTGRDAHVENFVIAGMLADALVFFGLVVASRWLVARADGLASRGPLVWRLALRDGTHRRGRVASAMVAAMAVATLLGGALVVNQSLEAERAAHNVVERPGWGRSPWWTSTASRCPPRRGPGCSPLWSRVSARPTGWSTPWRPLPLPTASSRSPSPVPRVAAAPQRWWSPPGSRPPSCWVTVPRRPCSMPSTKAGWSAR